MVESRKRVVFARINRRMHNAQSTLAESGFEQEIRILAESHQTYAVQPGTNGAPDKRWYAADFNITPDDRFLTGTLGYSEERTDREFNTESWSWLKGEEELRDTGSDDTIAPFAVDLRDDQRWVAFATASRLRHVQFRKGLELVLKQAVAQSGLLGYDWEVDLVTSKSAVWQWIEEHPEVFELKRTVKFTNPGRDLDDDRAEMARLEARRKTEEFRAYRSGSLQTDSAEFEDKLDGLESGFVEIDMRARGTGPGSEEEFHSRERADSTFIDSASFEQTAAGVLRALAGKVGEFARRVASADGRDV